MRDGPSEPAGRAGSKTPRAAPVKSRGGERLWKRRGLTASGAGQGDERCLGGFSLQASLPEADPVNFAPRVRVPVLMLNGRFDFVSPTATSQEPMFNLLGTPAERKRRIVYESSHSIPRNELIKEVVNWMETYWGTPTPHD
jgi:hypothetical protein